MYKAQDKKLPFFPENTEVFFPDLKVIHLGLNDIIHISYNHLKPFPNLVYLEMGYNRCYAIDGNLLSGTKKPMIYLNFSFNAVRRVGHNFIPYMSENGAVGFYGNSCINEGADTPDDVNELRHTLITRCS